MDDVAMSDIAPAVVSITRLAKAWRDQASRYRVEVNGKVVTALRPGQTVTLSADPGQLEVRIKLGLVLTSPKLVRAIGAGQWLYLECEPGSPVRAFSRPRSYIDLRERPPMHSIQGCAPYPVQ